MRNDDERIHIIISEINYWKEHKLLPTVYCDYLLALYTKGEGSSEDSARTRRKKSVLFYTINIVLLTLLLPFSFLIIYYTPFPSVIKISILLFFIGYIFIMYRFLTKQDHYFHHLALIVLLTLVLITTVYIGTIYTNNQLLTKLLLLLNFISWFVLGKKIRLKYLIVSSYFAIVFMFFYIVL